MKKIILIVATIFLSGCFGGSDDLSGAYTLDFEKTSLTKRLLTQIEGYEQDGNTKESERRKSTIKNLKLTIGTLNILKDQTYKHDFSYCKIRTTDEQGVHCFRNREDMNSGKDAKERDRRTISLSGDVLTITGGFGGSLIYTKNPQ